MTTFYQSQSHLTTPCFFSSMCDKICYSFHCNVASFIMLFTLFILFSWIMGRRPEFVDANVVARGEGREGMCSTIINRTEMNAETSMSVLQSRNFWKLPFTPFYRQTWRRVIVPLNLFVSLTQKMIYCCMWCLFRVNLYHTCLCYYVANM